MRGDVADDERADGATREQVGSWCAENRQPVENVRPGRSREKSRFCDGREPHAHRCLAAAEGEPVGRVVQIEVEAVVGCGLLQARRRRG